MASEWFIPCGSWILNLFVCFNFNPCLFSFLCMIYLRLKIKVLKQPYIYTFPFFLFYFIFLLFWSSPISIYFHTFIFICHVVPWWKVLSILNPNKRNVSNGYFMALSTKMWQSQSSEVNHFKRIAEQRLNNSWQPGLSVASFQLKACYNSPTLFQHDVTLKESASPSHTHYSVRFVVIEIPTVCHCSKQHHTAIYIKNKTHENRVE